MNKTQNTPNTHKKAKELTILAVNKLPEGLKANYKSHARKSSVAIEQLRVAAVLKLWNDRDYRDIRFDVPLIFGGKTVSIKVLAHDAEGGVVGVECVLSVNLGWLGGRVGQLRRCLPFGSWLVVVFPSGVDERVWEVVELADEVWITGKNGTVEQMMFMSFFHKE